ncbi:MAG: ribokinase [Roseomonas sp.]|nr:ribokinase [Roseomonas sp.]MCA3326559.1 ribokinase [Roseomonas sp.]MCA3331193.1 ribokinase [Roseomonas sp.]MCA3334809.1 ribokinase [Roseomonas sp.]MCA3345303.1 ribokinase [Roseomonas sp.]
MGGILVIGSYNRDTVLRLARFPAPGETLTALGMAQFHGGKGSNQAVAAARAGGRVALIAALGQDEAGEAAQALWAAEGIAAQAVQITGAPTGAATILLDAAGENQIIIIPGANAELNLPIGFPPPDDIAVVLGQLETPQAATAALFRALPKARCMLNVAPAAPILPELLAATDMLVLNETEAAILAQREAAPADLALALAAETMREVIVTAGALGAFWARPDGVVIDAAPPRVAITDTTGAGDAFLGAFAAFSAEGLAPERLLRQAVTAGALACTEAGAVPSLPYRAAILALAK